MSSLSRQQLVKYLGNVDVTGKRVLDIGSGDKSPYKVTKWVKGKPSEYITLDVDESLDPVFVMDLNHSFDINLDHPIVSDYVFCLEVLEHCFDPVQAMTNLLYITRERLYLSTPFINPIHDNWDYLRYTDEWFEKVIPRLAPSVKDINITPRIATEGATELANFYAEEGLRMSKVRLQRGDAYKLNHIGYFLEVIL